MAAATIPLAAVSLALMAAKMRRNNRGRTCQLCALSEAPLIRIDCTASQRGRASGLQRAQACGLSPSRISPMQRGAISDVFQRTHTLHGRQEVLRTWGAGVRALLAEPKNILNGGAA